MVSTALRSSRAVVVTNVGAGQGRDVALVLASRGELVFSTTPDLIDADLLALVAG